MPGSHYPSRLRSMPSFFCSQLMCQIRILSILEVRLILSPIFLFFLAIVAQFNNEKSIRQLARSRLFLS